MSLSTARPSVLLTLPHNVRAPEERQAHTRTGACVTYCSRSEAYSRTGARSSERRSMREGPAKVLGSSPSIAPVRV